MSWSSVVSGLGPSLWYRLNETSSSYADSGSGSHPASSIGSGVTRGVAGLVNGDSDKAASFDGTANAWIAGGNQDVNGGSYSIAAIVKLDGGNSSNYRRIISTMGASNGYEIGFMKSTDTPSNGIYFDHRVSGTTKEALSAALSTNTIYLVVCVYDTSADTMKIYVNGSQSGSTITSVTSDLTSSGFPYIGNTSSLLAAAAMSGVIDEVVIWKGTALSGTNITDLYNAMAPPPTPDAPTVGTPAVGTYGQVTFTVTDAGTGGASTSVSVVERSADGGSTWTDVTAACSISGSSSPYTVIDKRPTLNGQAVSIGGSAKYRVKVSNVSGASGYSSQASVSNVGYDVTAIRAKWAKTAHDYISARPDYSSIGITGYVNGVQYTTVGELQICEWLMAMAVAAYEAATVSGWVGTYGGPTLSQCVTDCQNQWTYVKWVASTYTGDRFLLLADDVSNTTPDRSLRPILHALIASRLLALTGDSTANTLAAEIKSKCDAWAAYYFDNCPTGSRAFTQYASSALTARANSTAYSVGDVRRPAADNGHGYRCITAGTSAGSAPTWNTTAGSTTTDGTVVWKETGTTVTLLTEGQSWNNTTHVLADTQFGLGGVWVNKAYSAAAALSLLCSDPACTSFYTAGTRKTNAQTMISAYLDAMMTRQGSDGTWPYTDGSGGNGTGKSTIYGAFNLSLLAMIKKLAAVSWPWYGDSSLTQGLAALETQHGSEPYTTISVTGSSATLGDDADSFFEMAAPLAAYTVTGRSNPTLDVLYSLAFNDSASGKWATYAKYGGGGTTYGGRSGTQYSPLDPLAIEVAVTGATFDATTRGSFTAAGRGATDRLADTATRGSATFAARLAADQSLTTDQANRGSVTFAGRNATDSSGGVTDTATRGGAAFNGRGAVDRTPGAAVRRPFFAPLDIAAVTAPLDVVAVTAPLDLDVEA